MAGGQVSAVGELNRIIHALAKDTSEISLADPAELIEQDSQILARIISVANTLGYNPAGARITCASDAIHVVGFDRIRSLALSLSLMEHVDRTHSDLVQNEMASLSLCSGLVAQAAAAHGCILDPDMAFICGSLRNFGRLLLSTFATGDFEQARRNRDNTTEDEAYRRTFGLTPLDLGYELLRSRGLPELVLNAVSEVPAAIVAALPWIDRQYVRLAQFSLELAEAAFDPDTPTAAFAERTEAIVARYQKDLPQLAKAVPEILAQTENRLLQLTKPRTDGGPDMVGLTRLRARRAGRDIARPAPLAAPAPAPAPSISDALTSIATVHDIAAALPLVLGSLQKDLACDHLLYCQRRPGSDDFEYAQGKSPLSLSIARRSLGGNDQRDIIFLCRSRCENIIIRDASAPKIRPYLPAWLKTAEAPCSFALLPVHHEGVMDAFVLVGWDAPSDLAFSADRLRTIRLLLGHLAKLNAGNRSPTRPPFRMPVPAA